MVAIRSSSSDSTNEDEELRDKLKEIDELEEVDVSTWEAEFIESVVYKNKDWPLTSKQREVARQMIERYL